MTPEKVDVASLITPDKLIVFITNTNYQINDSAYVWTIEKKVKVQISVPDWFTAIDGFEINPEKGLKPADWKMQNKFVDLSLDELTMGRVFVFSVSKDMRKNYENRFTEIINFEK
jgi:hypothetical protein